MRNLLVAQSGGPTSAINATIAGVIMEAHASDQVDTIYGAVNGIKGVLEERFVNLSEKVPGEEELEILCQTPAGFLQGKTEKSGRRRQPVSGNHSDFPQT